MTLQPTGLVYALGGNDEQNGDEMHVELRSKLIDAAEYDEESAQLKLFLTNGQIRQFSDVPAFVVDDLRGAKSPGAYYMKIIRQQYPAS